MQFVIAAVGHKMPVWVEQAWSDYSRRFSRGFSLELKEVPLARRTRNAGLAELLEQESQALQSCIPRSYLTIALDENGQQWSTRELAERMENWMREEKGVCFLVGGPDGLSPQIKAKTGCVWSLGNLTLPHPLARIVLAEQLYRAWSITQGHPYHRD